MSEMPNTITLLAKEVEVQSGDERKYLVAMFKPPLPKGQSFRKGPDGHYPSELIRDDEGGLRSVVYERGMFGGRDSDREKAFVGYWEKRARKIGYTLSEAVVHNAGDVAFIRTETAD